MKAWLLDALNGIEHQHLAEVPTPAPAAGEALLKIDFAALNPADYYLASGEYPAKPKLPHILGRDGVGTVTAVGGGVSTFKPGDRALILRSEIGVSRAGTFAEFVSVPVASLAPIPSGWTAEQSAAAPLVYLTAHQALTQWGELPPSVVLITGASGGVGVAATQLAVAMGHTVVGLSRSKDKGEKLKQLGAKFVLNPTASDWTEQLKAAVPNRVDLAVDNVAGPLFPQVIASMGNHGKVSVVGMLAGVVPQFNTASLFFRRLRVGGVAVGAYTPEESQAAWKAIVQILQKANVRPLIDSAHPFEQLPQAFAQLKRGPMGKVLLRVG